MEDDTRQFALLVGKIYDAALDSSLWREVVGKAGRFVGGPAAAIFSKSPITRKGNLHCVSGIEPHFQQLYFERYVKIDPTTVGQYFGDIGQPIAAADLISCSEFLETQFYAEWARPQGLVDFISAALDKSLASVTLFVVFRHERDGRVDDEMHRRMRLIVPHIRRSVLIGRLIDFSSAEAAPFADTLDGLQTAICTVDLAGRIVHANVACRAILDAADPLSISGGRLVANDSELNQALQELFAAAGADAIGTRGIALPLKTQGGARYVIHALPLTSGARRLASAANHATAALFIRRAELENLSPPEVIARVFNLTPTEMRVLLAIVEVGGVPEVASALGVAETTVKTHLSRLFVKTGVSRQADLVKIVAGFVSPLRGRATAAATQPASADPLASGGCRGDGTGS